MGLVVMVCLAAACQAPAEEPVPPGEVTASAKLLPTACTRDDPDCIQTIGCDPSACRGCRECVDDLCVPVRDGASCGTCRVCSSGSCTVNTGAACNDGNACTHTDRCNTNGQCAGTVYGCASSNPCKTAACNGAGGCPETNKLDGTPCDADKSLCTPQDKCQSGTCVADTPVTCVQEDCISRACNPLTGNCDATLKTGSPCGTSGCSTNGTCDTGVCSGQPKDCSPMNGPCLVGICDAADGNCKAQPVTNGVACTHPDKCLESTACLGGECTGTPKSCAAMASPCVDAACDPGSGNCVATNKPAGTACTLDNECLGSAQCDGNGNCAGTPLPDGTPCGLSDCNDATLCFSGTCTCGAPPAPADMAMPQGPADDGGSGGSSSCSFGGAPAAPLGLLFSTLGLLGLALRRRRR
jgi:MYXO-CTERM domain-containing protein